VKLGCSSWSYHAAFRVGRMDLLEWVQHCAEDLELDGIELVDLHFPTTDPVYLRDLKKRCTDLQLTISGVAVSNDFGPDERRAGETTRVQQWCDIAAYLGAPVVRVFAGWLPPGRTEREPGVIAGVLRRIFGQRGTNQRRLWSDVTWALRQCADYAAERGVVLALQNNRVDGLVATPMQLAQCIHDVGSPWLRICLDPADMIDLAGIDESLARVVQVHARLRDVGEDGADVRNHWPELLRTLKLAHYRGFVHLDYEGFEDPQTAVPRATRYMRGLLRLIERQQLLRPPSDDATSSNGAPAFADTAELPEFVAATPVG
jgi:sugar phosphate isomerase/epimerase